MLATAIYHWLPKANTKGTNMKWCERAQFYLRHCFGGWFLSARNVNFRIETTSYDQRYFTKAEIRRQLEVLRCGAIGVRTDPPITLPIRNQRPGRVS